MTSRFSLRLFATLLVAIVAGAYLVRAIPASQHTDQSTDTIETGMIAASVQELLPPAEADAPARLNTSRRHGEWATVQTGKNPVTGVNDSTRVWVVYPERRDKAPVVVVIHEIFGLTPWIRAVADQLAADGFIAVAPDFLSMMNVPGNPTDGPERGAATAAIGRVTTEEVHRQIDAVARYAMALPAATQKYGVVGFCWGGAASFTHAVRSPSLGAAVVYYGTSPQVSSLGAIKAPVLGLYASNDARVNATVPAADSAMKALGKPFIVHTFEGAGHGFLRQSNAQNVAASKSAWPLTVQFFKANLEAR